jgi:hypothetical protein
LGYCWIRASRFPMTKYTVNLPERLNLVIDGARNIVAGARFSISPQTVFDAIEPIRSAGIDAQPIAVFLCRRPRFAQASLALPSQPA